MADQSPTESDSSTTPEFPDKMRVHALAKLLGVTSKQVLAEAAALGTELRSAQSSLQRDVAQRIHASLTSAAEAIEPVVAELDTLIDPVVEAPVADEPAAEAPAEAPVAEAPAEKPVRARRTRKKAVVVEEPAAEEAVDPAVAEISAGLDAAAALQSKEAEQSDLFTSFEAPQTHQPEAAPAAPQVPLFLQPDLEAAEAAPRRRRARREPAAPAVVEEKQTAETETVAPEASPVTVPAVEEPAVTAPQTEGESAESDDEDDDQPRRRRRGRRGRGRGRGEQGGDQGSEQGSDEESDTATDSEQESAPVAVEKQTEDVAGEESGEKSESTADADSENADDSDLDADGSSRRRRRRRRRKTGTDGATDATATSEDDPPNTVVHEREPRNKTRVKDEVQGISGSTRLEAKRQRRRDGRDAGRRRPPILTESEFLARREAVDRVMVVRDRADSGQPHATTQVAVLEDGVLVEHFVTNSASASMVGNVYLGRVQNVLPSMEAAFIDIGRGRNGVLYAGEVNWEAAGLGGNSRKIEQALKPGDQVLVQVSKDPVGQDRKSTR